MRFPRASAGQPRISFPVCQRSAGEPGRHPARPRSEPGGHRHHARPQADRDRKSTRLNSSHLVISYAVFCLKKKQLAELLFGSSSGIFSCLTFVAHSDRILVVASPNGQRQSLGISDWSAHAGFFFFNDKATPEIYTLSLHDALPISDRARATAPPRPPMPCAACLRASRPPPDRKSKRLNSSHLVISYAVFCLKK